MNGDDPGKGPTTTREWQQYYPTYKYRGRDILLAEYGASAASAAAEEKLFLSSSNVAFIVAAAVSSLALGSLDRLYEGVAGVLEPFHVLIILLGLLLVFSSLTLRHFAERQKAIQFAKRKLVVLRAMLGLDYGPIQLVLPNWRLEGATQPFAIRLFPGWTAYAAYPFWVTGTFAAILLFQVLSHFLTRFAPGWTPLPLKPTGLSALAAVAWFVALAVLYRRSLYDVHERTWLSVALSVAAFLGLRVVDSIEYIIYRAKLADFELHRIGYQVGSSLNLLLFIEDRRFRQHRGVSLRGIVRAIRDRLLGRRISGGSTITQQLVRTLFIVDYNKTYRRKVVEIFLALWFEGVFSKEAILGMYVASVNYDAGVTGFTAAAIRLLGSPVRTPSRAQAFFLFERISNIRNRILVRRVDQLVTQAVAANLLSAIDAAELAKIYDQQAAGRLVPDDPSAFQRFLSKWQGNVT